MWLGSFLAFALAPTRFACRIIIAIGLLQISAACQSEEAPSSTFVGEIRGTEIFIPSEFEKSALVDFDPMYIEYYVAGDFRQNKIRAGNISHVLLILRRATFKPILSLTDEVEFRLHREDGFDARDLTRAWITARIEATDGLPIESDQIIGAARKDLKCESKLSYGLKHCKLTELIKPSLFETFEYFYDEHNKETIVWCRKIRGMDFYCTHQFSSGVPNVMVTTDYKSTAEIKRWKEVETGIRKVISEFLKK
jgi:hypothetical protein